MAGPFMDRPHIVLFIHCWILIEKNTEVDIRSTGIKIGDWLNMKSEEQIRMTLKFLVWITGLTVVLLFTQMSWNILGKKIILWRTHWVWMSLGHPNVLKEFIPGNSEYWPKNFWNRPWTLNQKKEMTVKVRHNNTCYELFTPCPLSPSSQ